MMNKLSTFVRANRSTRLALTGLALSLAVVAGIASTQKAAPSSQAQTIAQALIKRIPNLTKVDAVTASPVAGLYEVQIGTQVFYTDAKGDYLIDGQLIDTKTMRNLTQERVDDLNRIDFASLPLKDAIVWKNGTGARKLVVFSDPRCGYCKRLERTFSDVKDVTVYSIVIGILGDESKQIADNIWCLDDRTNAWRDWMLSGKAPARVMSKCETPLTRNMTLAQKMGVNGTPTMVFEDGTRLAAAVTAEQIEERLKRASTAAKTK